MTQVDKEFDFNICLKKTKKKNFYLKLFILNIFILGICLIDNVINDSINIDDSCSPIIYNGLKRC